VSATRSRGTDGVGFDGPKREPNYGASFEATASERLSPRSASTLSPTTVRRPSPKPDILSLPVSYVVFARKYRPMTFDEVVGQEHVGQTLKNAIAQDRLAHAYLFSGPRGVGKTTMARILAKAVNCLVSPGDHPCGQCEACTSIAAGQDIDVLELDAASRRKVEDIEPLIDSSRYLPQRSPRKIFIVDEAHMLSKTAWNALLKTLEEPPAHVMFIFATTEPSKVIETVRSRCQRFDFKRITEKDIVGKLRRIADAEGATVDDEVYSEIATRATGGMRDAETLLDQALGAAPTDRALGTEDLVAILGGTPRAERAQILSGAHAGRMKDILASAAALVDAGADPVELLQDLFDDVHATAVAKASGASPRAGLEALDVEWCLAAADLLSRHRRMARESRAARASLDLGLLAVARLGDVRDLEELVERLERIATDAPSIAGARAPSIADVRAPSIADARAPSIADARAPKPAHGAAHGAAHGTRAPTEAPKPVRPAPPPRDPTLAATVPKPQAPRLTLPTKPTAPPPPPAPKIEPPAQNSAAAPATGGGDTGSGDTGSGNTEPSRPAAAPTQAFSAEEMGRVRAHPRVREVLDTFRGRIEQVRRTDET